MADNELLLGHSPDPDDAFMFYGLACGKVEAGRWRFRHILEDIQSLNERATRGELHITAISVHAYPYVRARYALLACGGSCGEGYGPVVVSRSPMGVEDLRGKTIAVPGRMTTAYLVLRLLLGADGFVDRVVMFDRILDEVAAGRADAGLVIHEGQLTYEQQGLCKIVDLGGWWYDQTQLPLPLGANVVRRDLGTEAMAEIAEIIRRSIRYGLAHREEAVAYSLQYARQMGAALADRFVGMYVNERTLDYGETGRQAIRELLGRGHEAGIVPDPGRIDFVG